MQGLNEPCCVVNFVASVCVLHNGFSNGEALKRLGQIDGFATIAQLQMTCCIHGSVTHQLFGKAHQVLVVPISRVELHHGEFGVVANGNAFVAEVAVDFEHPLKPPHQQAFQVQLRRNAQVHFLVKRIVVRDKGAGVGTARNRVQHGCFNF